MKPHPRYGMAAIACIILLLPSCGASPQSRIIGSWEVEGAPMSMTAEFHPDGTAQLTMLGQTVHGTYKVSSENELFWTMNGITSQSKVNITATELELTNDRGQTVKYQRK